MAFRHLFSFGYYYEARKPISIAYRVANALGPVAINIYSHSVRERILYPAAQFSGYLQFRNFPYSFQNAFSTEKNVVMTFTEASLRIE